MKKLIAITFATFVLISSAFAQDRPTISIQSSKDWKKHYHENFQAVQRHELYVPGQDLVLTLETSPLFVIGDMASGKGPEIELPLMENGKLVFKKYRNYRATQQLNRWIVRTASGKDLPDGIHIREILTVTDAQVVRVDFKNSDTGVALFKDKDGVKKGVFVDQIGIPYVDDEKPTHGFSQTMSQALYIYREGDAKMVHFATFVVRFAPDKGELSYNKMLSYPASTVASR